MGTVANIKTAGKSFARSAGGLDTDDFDAGIHIGSDDFISGSGVGDYCVEFVEPANVPVGGNAEFAVIDDSDAAAGLFDHGGVDFSFVGARAPEAEGHVDSAGSQKECVDDRTAKIVDAGLPDDGIPFAAKIAAGHIDFDVFAYRQRHGHAEAICDNGEVCVIGEGADDFSCRRARRDSDGLSGADQFCGCATDAAFLGGETAQLRLICRVVLKRLLKEHVHGLGAAVFTTQHAFIREQVQIAPDRHHGYAKELGEFFDRDAAVLLEQLEYGIETQPLLFSRDVYPVVNIVVILVIQLMQFLSSFHKYYMRVVITRELVGAKQKTINVNVINYLTFSRVFSEWCAHTVRSQTFSGR